VVSAEEKEVFGKSDLKGEQKADCFNALAASVHIVSEEEVICLGWIFAFLENAKQIEILTMNIATYCQRGLQVKQWRLIHEYRPHLFTEKQNIQLGEILWCCYRAILG
jgi:hypothetical protein